MIGGVAAGGDGVAGARAGGGGPRSGGREAGGLTPTGAEVGGGDGGVGAGGDWGVGPPEAGEGAGALPAAAGAPEPETGGVAVDGGVDGGAEADAVDGAEASGRDDGCAYASVAIEDDVTSAHERSAYEMRRLCMGQGARFITSWLERKNDQRSARGSSSARNA